MAKSPIEPMVDHTPMSASEGGLFLLVGGALIGVGYLIGTAKVWKKKFDEVSAQPQSRRPASSSGQHRQPNKTQK